MAHDPNHGNHALAVAEPTNGQVSKTVTGPVVLAGERDAAPPGLSSAPTVAGLWQALKRRWRLAVPLAIGAGVLAVAAVFIFMPPRYVVEYIVYHEMLHLRHPVKLRGSRRSVHSFEFQAEEKLFPRLDRAKQFLREL